MVKHLFMAPPLSPPYLCPCLTSSLPTGAQVNDYPFTTRGVTVGHIVDRDAGTRYQVMDTPGGHLSCCNWEGVDWVGLRGVAVVAIWLLRSSH